MINKWQIAVVALLEGAVVMAVEIASAKLIAPWFGASLYVWASVLGVTMAGLAGGYFIGGRLSQSPSKLSILGLNLSLAGMLTLVMPFLGAAIMSATLHWEPRWGSLLSSMVFLFPPIFFLGTVSPLLVALAEKEGAGKAAGTIYGISTLGGILMTFGMGFWLMPTFGIKAPLMVFSGLLAFLGLALLWKGKAGRKQLMTLLWLPALLLGTGSEAKVPDGKEGQVLHAEWGINGEVVVQDEEGPNGLERVALINRREQSRVSLKNGENCAQHHYVSMMSRLAALKPSGSRTLLLGLGGGSLLKELDRLGHRVEGCEIDARMIRIADQYFEAPPQLAAIRNEDARVCINQMEGKYDMVLVDVFWGLQGPSHVLTLESLHQIHRHLDTKGLLAILFPGPLTGIHAQSLAKTMREAGFQVAVAAPPGIGSTSLVLLGSHLPYSPQYFSPGQGTVCAQNSGLPTFIPAIPVEIHNDAVLLTDDAPKLEVLMMPLAKVRH